MLEEVWTGSLTRGPTPEEIMQALGKGYKWSEGPAGRYQLSRIRFLIANYNPELVPMDERAYVQQAQGVATE